MTAFAEQGQPKVMPLARHLRELRNGFAISGLAIAIAIAIGAGAGLSSHHS